MPLSGSNSFRSMYDDAVMSWSEMEVNSSVYDLARAVTRPTTRLAAIKKEERDNLRLFIEDGSPHELELYQEGDHCLVVKGNTLMGSEIMFFINLDSKTITMHNERSKHLVRLLDKLARREGFTINKVEAMLACSRNMRRLLYWKFDNAKEVDDSKLIEELVKPVEVDPVPYPTADYRLVEPIPAVWTRDNTPF